MGTRQDHELEEAGRGDSGRPDSAAATLGDVLYARRAAGVESEEHWVALVRAVAAGDQLALHALYRRTHRLVFTLLVRITASRETAEELTVDVFHGVWRNAPSYDPANGTVIGWIINQARSRAIDRLRFEHRMKRQPVRAEDPSTDDTVADAHALLELRQRGQTLRAALARLTAGERQAIEAAYFSELTHAEVAARLGEPLGTIKTRIRSGLDKLRRALDSGGEIL